MGGARQQQQRNFVNLAHALDVHSMRCVSTRPPAGIVILVVLSHRAVLCPARDPSLYSVSPYSQERCIFCVSDGLSDNLPRHSCVSLGGLPKALQPRLPTLVAAMRCPNETKK